MISWYYHFVCELYFKSQSNETPKAVKIKFWSIIIPSHETVQEQTIFVAQHGEIPIFDERKVSPR